MTFTYRLESEIAPYGYPVTRQVASRDDGTTVELVAIDREETLKFEYSAPQTKAVFYCSLDPAASAVTFHVYRRSIWSLDGGSLTQEQVDRISADIAEALAGWPDDWTADKGTNPTANIVNFVD